MSKMIRETKETPVVNEVDVVVCGGGAGWFGSSHSSSQERSECAFARTLRLSGAVWQPEGLFC